MTHSTLLLQGVQPIEVALPEDPVLGPQEAASVHLLRVGLPDRHRHPLLCRRSFPRLPSTLLRHIHRLRKGLSHISVLVNDELLLLMSLRRLTSSHHHHPPVRKTKGAGGCSLTNFVYSYIILTSCIFLYDFNFVCS
ncbi:uncharacterized protein LOC130800023 isoform X1 [Amaranthus tricolor]|uniref:uncharacterized protein LOC130800023 isoform X1 n=1 Tax=Amaranthus tricolor TaxID=29722 RepID=UPI002586617C|nr:uncharacterized protein LOC130800023 isoform X1 [Amaranthus tricolor]